jgi:hypothetical protein
VGALGGRRRARVRRGARGAFGARRLRQAAHAAGRPARGRLAGRSQSALRAGAVRRGAARRRRAAWRARGRRARGAVTQCGAARCRGPADARNGTEAARCRRRDAGGMGRGAGWVRLPSESRPMPARWPALAAKHVRAGRAAWFGWALRPCRDGQSAAGGPRRRPALHLKIHWPGLSAPAQMAPCARGWAPCASVRARLGSVRPSRCGMPGSQGAEARRCAHHRCCPQVQAPPRPSESLPP